MAEEQPFDVTIYFKSGNHFTVTCTKFEVKNGDYSWTTKGKTHIFNFDIDQVEAITYSSKK